MYRAAVIGCGRVGCGFDDDPLRGYISTHAGAYTHTPGVELVALVDVDTARLQKYGDKFKVPGRYTDYRAMLREQKPDFVSICTWNDTHLPIVNDAVDAGVRAVFCEKPIADTLASADAIIRKCDEAGVVLMIDHHRRFDKSHQQLAAFIRGNKLGTIQQATFYYGAGIANTGSHLLDLLRSFFGDIAWVQGMTSTVASPSPNDPNIDGFVVFQNGTTVALQALDFRQYAMFELTILGTAGRIRLSAFGTPITYEEAKPSERYQEYRELYPKEPPMRLDAKPEFLLQAVSHLIDCVEHRASPLCSGADGRAALEAVCALRESAAAGGLRISLPLLDSLMVISSK